MKPRPNAICLGGPCHGMLVRVEQDIGVLRVPLPANPPQRSADTADYRITMKRVHHPSCQKPFVALHWAGQPSEQPLTSVRG